jgi:hypothetical protein
MGGELTGQLVVLEERWKRIQLAQDLNLVRAKRVVPDVRPAVVAEQATGPLDSVFHAVDLRRPSARTGRYDPRQIAHWLYPTITFRCARRPRSTAVSRVPTSASRYTHSALAAATHSAADRRP